VQSGARRAEACARVGLDPRTEQRWRKADGGTDGRRGPNTPPTNRLTDEARAKVLTTANAEEFRGLSPKQIVPTLADRGDYIASESSFYRVLREHKQMTHRTRSQAPRPRPDHREINGPNQVWSWDITYLKSPVRGQFYYLYLIIDVWSRKAVGWSVHEREDMNLSAALIKRTASAECVEAGQLVLHSDNGGPMRGTNMKAMLESLGIAASYSRPRVSNDNPFSESLFHTVKYRPEYPDSPFDSLQEAEAWVEAFVAWYNTEHLHSAIRYVTPEDRHAGRQASILAKRAAVYAAAREQNRTRWSGACRDWSPVEVVHLHADRAAS
jgi:transposase InsO family protein